MNNSNPYYSILYRPLRSSKVIRSYNKIYFLGDFQYSEDNYSKFKEASSIREFLEQFKGHSQKDNVDVFFIESDDATYLLTLFDPFELWSPEYVMDVINSPNIKLDDFKSTLIYSRSSPDIVHFLKKVLAGKKGNQG